jgi:hypothetical protein
MFWCKYNYFLTDKLFNSCVCIKVQNNLLNKKIQSFAKRNASFAANLQNQSVLNYNISNLPVSPTSPTAYVRSSKNSQQDSPQLQSASKAATMPGSAVLQIAPHLRHTSFYAGTSHDDSGGGTVVPDDALSAARNFHNPPSSLHHDFALPMEDNSVLQGESSEVADSVDLSLLPHRHSMQMHQQQIQADVESALRKSKIKTRSVSVELFQRSINLKL